MLVQPTKHVRSFHIALAPLYSLWQGFKQKELIEKGVTGMMRNLENSHWKEAEGLDLKKRGFT